MDFQISALAQDRFEHLSSLSDDALARHGATRVIATHYPGFPCRVTLEDAPVGQQLFLANYEHLNCDTPFRSRYAVYVRTGAGQAEPAVNQVPEILRSRTLSLRAWTEHATLAGAELVEGKDIENGIASLLSLPDAAFIHIHFAKPGCYAARVDRA